MATFLEQKMLRLFDKYELSDNVTPLFEAYDDFKKASMDEYSLGRLVRFSPENRAALLDTMTKCANIMRTNPKERNHCCMAS
ncbi:hypothetical protein GGR57DRAFT_496374 [Xylariaceae sp. FL1272]|nr:hypothetical protein GGR57DRAFT_496374 [Xylariaceae sp. FL1272]